MKEEQDIKIAHTAVRISEKLLKKVDRAADKLYEGNRSMMLRHIIDSYFEKQ